MNNIAFFQFSRVYDGQVYLPLSVGMLWAYARTFPIVQDAYRSSGFVVLRRDPDAIVADLEPPDVAAFSTYGWNWEMSLAVASRIKRTHPNSLIVFGGPHVPSRAAAVRGFFERHPFVDVAVHGEGEIPFAELLCARASGSGLHGVAGLTIRDGAAKSGAPALITTPPRSRASDLDRFPSPYLEGLFDELLRDRRYTWQATWETNRGCPYACTFCDWGGLDGQKLYCFGMERLLREIAWFGDNQMEYVYGADANFGMLERDVRLAEELVKTKHATGFPAKYRGNYAKNQPERVLAVAKLLHAVGLNKSISIAVQSMEPTTLALIKRRNMKYHTLASFVREYRRLDIAAFTEVIMGMPGETYESFTRGIDELLGAGFHDCLDIYNCAVFPNAEMSDPPYAKQHRLEIRRVPQFLRYCEGADPVVEYEDIVVSTATMSVEAFKACVAYAWIVQLCHSMNLTTVLAVYLQAAHGMTPSRFYGMLLEFAAASPQTLIGQEYSLLREHTDAWVDRGASRDVTAPEFSPLVLDPEQVSFLRISHDFGRFFAELDAFLSFLDRKAVVSIEPSIRRDLSCLQEALVVKWRDGGSRTIELRHALYEFFCAASCGETKPLRQGDFTVRIDDPYDFADDRSRYAREIVIWGRRDGKTRYRGVSEHERVTNASAPARRMPARDEMIAAIGHGQPRRVVRSRPS